MFDKVKNMTDTIIVAAAGVIVPGLISIGVYKAQNIETLRRITACEKDHDTLIGMQTDITWIKNTLTEIKDKFGG